MSAEILKEKRPLDPIDCAGALLEGAFEPIDGGIRFAESERTAELDPLIVQSDV